MEQLENQLVITGQLVRSPEVRITPAGVSISRFLLVHRSSRTEAGRMREVQCRIRAVASDSDLEKRIARLSPGDWVTVTGFLSRAGYRAPETSIELHVMKIETVPADG